MRGIKPVHLFYLKWPWYGELSYDKVVSLKVFWSQTDEE